MDTIYQLVKFARETKYEDIPQEAILKAKIELADILACISAGTTANISQEVAELVTGWGGKEESTVMIMGQKIPAHHAAFVNSLLAHARDYDDFQAEAIVHPGVSVIPTALAVSEAVGGIDGKELLRVIVVADDIAIRMASAIKVGIMESGWIYSSVIGHFAAALTASLLLGLNEEQTINAMGIVYSQVAGNQQAATDTALTKRMQPAFACRSGIFSAYLASIGVTGAHNVLDGSYGFYKVYIHDKCDKSILTKDLGKEFMIGRLSYKFYPFCGLTQGAIASTFKLVEEYDIKPEEVKHIEVGTSQQGIELCAEPKETKFNPKTMVDAQFSIPFCIATILTERKLGLKSLEPEGVANPRMRQLLPLISCHVDPDIDRDYSRGVPPEEVTIETTRGTFTANEWWKGNPIREITMNDTKEKFEDAMSVAMYPVKEGAVDRVVDMIGDLEALDDVTTLYQLYNDSFIR